MIILLNGPPGSGKDEVAKYLVSDYGFTNHKFAQPLIDAAVAFWGIDPGEYDSWKNQELSWGFTGRDWIIELAETVTKPRLGSGYFGKRAATAVINDPNQFVVVSDAGFGTEVDKFIAGIKNAIPKRKIIIWYIRRPGKSFSKDSRKFLSKLDYDTQEIVNDGTLDDLKNQVTQAIFWHFHETPADTICPAL